jgi:hypothetical protein
MDAATRTLGPARVLIVDSESVEDAADYIPLVGQIAGLTAGVLRFDAVTCVEAGAYRRLEVMHAGRRWTGLLEVESDGIDTDGLLSLLNAILSACDAEGRMYAFEEPGWGQELGLLYAGEEELPRLRAARVILEHDALSEPRADETLAEARVIHGYVFLPTARVEYWQDPPFDEMEVTLGVAQELAGLTLPATTSVVFTEEGALLCCVIRVAHPPFAAGTRIPFGDGRWQLDAAETNELYR